MGIYIGSSLTHFWIQFGLREPVKSIHVFVLLMLGETLEDTSPVRFLYPFDLHCFNCPAAYNLVQSRHHGYCCPVLQLFDNWTCLCHKSKKIQIVSLFHSETIGLFKLLSLYEVHYLGPGNCKLGLLLFLLGLLLSGIRTSLAKSTERRLVLLHHRWQLTLLLVWSPSRLSCKIVLLLITHLVLLLVWLALLKAIALSGLHDLITHKLLLIVYSFTESPKLLRLG